MKYITLKTDAICKLEVAELFKVFGQLSYWQSTESLLYIRVYSFTIFQEGTFDYK